LFNRLNLIPGLIYEPEAEPTRKRVRLILGTCSFRRNRSCPPAPSPAGELRNLLTSAQSEIAILAAALPCCADHRRPSAVSSYRKLGKATVPLGYPPWQPALRPAFWAGPSAPHPVPGIRS